MEYFPNLTEIQFPKDPIADLVTTLYRAGHDECVEPDVHNFVTSATLNPARMPPNRFIPPPEIEYVRYCDFAVVLDASDAEQYEPGWRVNNSDLMVDLMYHRLPAILSHPIRRLSLNDCWDGELWGRTLQVRDARNLPLLHLDQGTTPVSPAYFAGLGSSLGELRSLRFTDADGYLDSITKAFTDVTYPKLESLHILMEPHDGSFGDPPREPLPPNLRKIDIDVTVHTFSLNSESPHAFAPDKRLPLRALRQLKEHAGSQCEVRARVITNAYSDRPRLQRLVDEALGMPVC